MPLEVAAERVAAIPRGKTGKALLIKPRPQRDRVTARTPVGKGVQP